MTTPLAANGLWTPRTLSILVPALNEEHNLEPTIERLQKALSINVEDYEILIINDGSTDCTGAVADRLARANPRIRVLHFPTRSGLGACYQRGIALARKAFFGYVPGDNTWPYRSLLELFGNLGKAEVLTSYATNPEVRPWGRRLISSLYTRTLNLLLHRRMRYYNGLTIYPLSFLQTCPVQTHGFGFQAELLLQALCRGLSVLELGLSIEERAAGGSKAVTLPNIASVLATMARLCSRLRNRKPRPAEAPATPSRSAGANGKPLRIVITGASSGIGAALTQALAGDGHELFVCARRGERLNEVTRNNTLARGWTCDVADEEQVKAFLDQVRAATPSIDALINCAGGFGAIGPLEMTDSEEWWQTLRVNLFGAYLTIKYALPLLEGSTCPRIINLAGGGAFSSFPNYSAYACSEAALVRLTECLAAELAPRGIAVNALAPGIVATEAHEATLRAGEEKAGALHYRRTVAILSEGGAPMAQVIDCARALLSPDMDGLSAKTISANFDPWSTPSFQERIPEITRSDLYTSRRCNIVNLPDGSLKEALSSAWANHAREKGTPAHADASPRQ